MCGICDRTDSCTVRPFCRVCGGDVEAPVRWFKAGMQTTAFDTYAPNLAATAEKERVERERQNVERWHE